MFLIEIKSKVNVINPVYFENIYVKQPTLTNKKLPIIILKLKPDIKKLLKKHIYETINKTLLSKLLILINIDAEKKDFNDNIIIPI